MAPGCEPAAVRRMMDVLGPHAHGQSLAGAGGGGFMFVIAKEPDASEKLEALVRSQCADHEDIRFHQVEIDREGLVIRTEPAE